MNIILILVIKPISIKILYFNLSIQVYMLNKSEYKSKLEVNKMKTCIENLMSGSKLIYKGSISSIESNSTSILLASSTKQKRRDIETDSVNFVLMPKSKDGNVVIFLIY